MLLVSASLSDALDGALSRRWGATSALGSILDPVCDKLYTISLFTCLMIVGQCPVWFLGLLITASLLQIGGVVLLRLPLSRARPVIQPSRIGKLSTALQMIWIVVLVTENLAVRRGMSSHFGAFLFWGGFGMLAGLQTVAFCQYAFRYRTRLIPGFLQAPVPRG